MNEERRRAREKHGIAHWIAGRGAKGWAKALAVLVPAVMIGLWLLFG